MADIKATSFRLNEEDIAKFKAFAEQEGYNQAEAFNSLMQTLEMARAKGMIKDRAKEIEVFQDTVNNLVSMFLNSLNINQLSEERIREELSLELGNKDNTISNLLHQVETLKSDNKKLNDTIKEMEEINKGFDEQIFLLTNDIKEKQKNIDKLNSNNDLLQEQLQEYKQYKTNYNELEKELEEVKSIKEDLVNSNNKLKNENELLDSKLQSNEDMLKFYKEEIDIKNTSMNDLKADIKELEDKYSKKIEETNIKYDKKIDELNKQHDKKIDEINKQHDNKLKELKETNEKILQDNISNINSKHEIELGKKDLETQTLKNKIKELEKIDETLKSKKIDKEK